MGEMGGWAKKNSGVHAHLLCVEGFNVGTLAARRDGDLLSHDLSELECARGFDVEVPFEGFDLHTPAPRHETREHPSHHPNTQKKSKNTLFF